MANDRHLPCAHCIVPSIGLVCLPCVSLFNFFFWLRLRGPGCLAVLANCGTFLGWVAVYVSSGTHSCRIRVTVLEAPRKARECLNGPTYGGSIK